MSKRKDPAEAGECKGNSIRNILSQAEKKGK